MGMGSGREREGTKARRGREGIAWNQFFLRAFFATSRLRVLFLLFLAVPSFAGSSNSLMDISADGKLLACSNRDSGTVSIVDLATNKKLREVKVGQKPEG